MFDVGLIRGSSSSGSVVVHENSFDLHESIFSLMALLLGLTFWIDLIWHWRDSFLLLLSFLLGLLSLLSMLILQGWMKLRYLLRYLLLLSLFLCIFFLVVLHLKLCLISKILEGQVVDAEEEVEVEDCPEGVGSVLVRQDSF